MTILSRRSALFDMAGVALAFGVVLGTTLYARPPASQPRRVARRG